MPVEAPLLARALDTAVRAHEGQRRQGGKVPYATHLMRVVGRVHAWGLTDDAEVLAAAALHDVVEDTDLTLEDVQDEFGDRVADLVDRLTHEQGLKPRERTRVILDQLAEAPLEAVLIKAADRLDNILDMPWRAKSRLGFLGEAEEIADLAERRLSEAPAGPVRDALEHALPEYREAIEAQRALAERDLATGRR